MLLFCMGSLSVFAQDRLPGYYKTKDPFSDAESIVYLYKTKAGTYAGKVYQVVNDPQNKYVDYLFLWNLQYDSAKNEYSQGYIKYPGIPGTYRTYMQFEPDGRLRVRGYLGFSALGKTLYWERVTNIK